MHTEGGYPPSIFFGVGHGPCFGFWREGEAGNKLLGRKNLHDLPKAAAAKYMIQ